MSPANTPLSCRGSSTNGCIKLASCVCADGGMFFRGAQSLPRQKRPLHATLNVVVCHTGATVDPSNMSRGSMDDTFLRVFFIHLLFFFLDIQTDKNWGRNISKWPTGECFRDQTGNGLRHPTPYS